MSGNWIEVCGKDEIDEEDVIRFDHGGRTFAVYRSPDDEFFATDGLCTHEHIHLADGLVMDEIIECPKHNGRFNYKTGEAKGCAGLRQSQDLPGKDRRRQCLHLGLEEADVAHFVIIGAGECGARAAFALREKGFAGEITLVGAEPLHPYERPPLSKAVSADASDPKFIATLEKYVDSGIRLLTGVEARDLNTASRTVSLSGGTTLSYDKLLLATGASARSFPGAPTDSPHIRSLRTHHDAAALRDAMKPERHIAIIGGGFIGLELAATARLLGAEVTVVEGLERVLKRGVPEEIAHLLTKRHRAEGVDIRCGVSIAALTEEGGKAVIRLSTGEVMEADLALVGIGARPNVELAEKAG
ncbi:MocE family 2Fe-2S type ferredoxin, partial [Rhizobium sp. Pop5]|uniref:MocE family 2Fe-2S type ferredoxin n=1 Tax=Rhizobium sp. Pop5 TaxID=1223565 RepID=UPI000283986C